MENKKLKILFHKKSNNETNRNPDYAYTLQTTLPIKYCRNMEITPEDREVNCYYDEENKIMIISKNKLNNIKITFD